jgi:hypothetical protein
VHGEYDARTIMKKLGLEYVSPGANATEPSFEQYSRGPLPPIAIDGYSYAIHISLRPTRDSVKIVGGAYLKVSADTTVLHVTRAGVSILEIPLLGAVDSAIARDRSGRPPDSSVPLCLHASEGDAAALACIAGMTYQMKPHQQPRLTWLEGELFLKLPK